MPTVEQAFACVRVFSMLSTGYQPVHLFRYNPKTGIIYILAGVTESIEILIPPDGEWEFVYYDET
ncbi:hypothetical protein DSM106972_003530 [Dulcicalothrix desertica PCC 7102]|uniref:DUF6888 domain-containing protein n=1 Tax=Dulcicalothrix desertica PCC 7102 TaxID=232991 RepID=A0A3S1ASD6_9CYAN|nr:hypothetical protein [Dulcicalothrix desertica]RUT09858.1 hypothetical protein DSM106972_003530 [Dulcicalothrix desertica PCC 7102]TWH51044.1 hypothetical protein CAL7102_05408 [Dulcicalothrix desertica PCC 7102]